MIKLNRFDTPVLFIPFNRPVIAEKVFNKIREIKPQKFYVFIDGPRNEQDVKLCDMNKSLIDSIDWSCDLYTKYMEKNLGPGRGVAEAISWVFEVEEKAIILEEDNVPAVSFFNFCAELLEKYKNDQRIGCIHGANFFENIKLNNKDSYFFSKYGIVWGIATWKRVWKNYDFKITNWEKFKDGGYFFDDIYYKQARFAFEKYDSFFNEKKTHTWDAQFGFYLWSNRMLGIVPVKNLIKNIGYVGANFNKRKWFQNFPVDENFKIEGHPEFILRNIAWDNIYYKTFRRRKNVFSRLYKKLIDNK